jgi:2-polyprenyl-3-methyl-5-hydroxy-6-metoxy-1,4-benzoquinol methylase
VSVAVKDGPMHPTPHSFRVYRRRAVEQAKAILSQANPGEYDEQALPAYAHSNPLMRWLFWQRLRRVVRHFEQNVSAGSRVLDFGCGIGMLLPLLAAHGHRLTGVDLDIRQAQAFLHFFGVTDATILPVEQLGSLPKGSIDVITALDVLEHVPDLAGIVAQLGDLLRPGGRLIACGPTENILYKLGRWLAGFTGDYHVRNIEDIHQAIRRHYPTTVLGTLYPGLPLFRLFEAIRPVQSAAAD